MSTCLISKIFAVYKKVENLCYTLKKDICALPGSVTGKYSYIKTCNQKEVFKGEKETD